MTSMLLVIIYLAFISLGLPDSLLGSAWPVMYGELSVPVSYAGVISMIIAGGTIISSLFSGKLIRKLGTGKVTMLSVALTALALMGFAFSHSFLFLCLWGIPYGLGAGSVDAALNHYVAVHYKARHMSWLHCFWGVGATVGPYLMGRCIADGKGWNQGYQLIGIIQIVLVAILILSLPLWGQKKEQEVSSEPELSGRAKFGTILGLRGARAMLAAFFCYCALETTTGLWASSYLVLYKKIPGEMAAKWAALFYLGITVGRFVSGFVTDRLGGKRMVRIGQGIIGLGILFLFLPVGTAFSLVGLVLIGLGCAPIYPSLIHETPEKFGQEHAQMLIGMQMACAYTGSTFMPPVFGAIAGKVGIAAYPVYLLVFILIMFLMVERVNRLHEEK